MDAIASSCYLTISQLLIPKSAIQAPYL